MTTTECFKSLREALAQYALGEKDDGGDEEIVAPIEELVKALVEAIEVTESTCGALALTGTDCR